MKTRQEILAAPSTRRLVGEALALADKRDIVDAMGDLRLAAKILENEFWASMPPSVAAQYLLDEEKQ